MLQNVWGGFVWFIVYSPMLCRKCSLWNWKKVDLKIRFVWLLKIAMPRYAKQRPYVIEEKPFYQPLSSWRTGLPPWKFVLIERNLTWILMFIHTFMQQKNRSPTSPKQEEVCYCAESRLNYSCFDSLRIEWTVKWVWSRWFYSSIQIWFLRNNL